MAEEQRSKQPTWARLAMLLLGGFAIGFFVYAIHEHYFTRDDGVTRQAPLLSRLRGMNTESVTRASVNRDSTPAISTADPQPPYAVIPAFTDAPSNSNSSGTGSSEMLGGSIISGGDSILVDTSAPASPPQGAASEATSQNASLINVLRPEAAEKQEADAYRIVAFAVDDSEHVIDVTDVEPNAGVLP
uniref:Putative transmembrane protein n=1 Tax=Toxoplasma gondii COUG TaxID=1074873 RepID=A0A2G8YCZ3_TOXGO|nr:putative transmembrane protein [Toxoplasma gondii COUG]